MRHVLLGCTWGCILGTLFLPSMGCGAHDSSTESVQRQDYAANLDSVGYITLRDEITHDTPGLFQLEIDLLVSLSLSKAQILDLLAQKYNEAIGRRDVIDRQGSAVIYLKAFHSEEYNTATYRKELAYVQKNLGQEPRVEFNDALYAQLLAPPEFKWGLSEEERKRFYREYLDADWSGWREAERQIPTDADAVLKPGDRFALRNSLGLMPHLDAERWLEEGAPSLSLPVGTTIHVIETIQNNQGSKWTFVRAEISNDNTLYQGWLDTISLGYASPMLADPDVFGTILEEQARLAERLAAQNTAPVLNQYGITKDIADKIRNEGFEKQWPQ